MNLFTLCDKIKLQPHIRERVLAFAENFDFRMIDSYQKDYEIYEKMDEARLCVQEILGADHDGMKIFSCMLKAAADSYEFYRRKGIPDEIYFSTMECFRRFLDETYRMTGKVCFDRCWWTTRQVGGHLFRVGALEYEITPKDKSFVIDIHIPSDADFSPDSVEKSLQDADSFFSKYFPSLGDVEYHCCSWLLDRQLRSMLGVHSNIVNFQNRFEILDEGEADDEFMDWLFHKRSKDYAALPEKTSLQKNVKKHLLEGGVIRCPYGRMNRSVNV